MGGMAVPLTRNGLNSFEVISALQKAIRRGQEEEAMHLALEMSMTSKAFHTRMLNRLFVIAHEDIGLASVGSLTFAMSTLTEIRAVGYEGPEPEKIGKWVLALGNVIRALCRAQKSREGDWFAIIAVQNVAAGNAPKIPDYALDKHTHRGRAMGRGLDHFLDEGRTLHPAPRYPEKYEERAIDILRNGVKKQGGGQRALALETTGDEE